MKVHELIERLQKQLPQAEVLIGYMGADAETAKDVVCDVIADDNGRGPVVVYGDF